jgi:hypothetical protein
MSVDIEIYMSNIIKFFRENPKDLLNLIPKEMEDNFYVKIRETASSNYDEGKEVSLTQKQMIDICRQLNGQVVEEDVKNSKIFQKTKFGDICLN